jgi:hypothetical protein
MNHPREWQEDEWEMEDEIDEDEIDEDEIYEEDKELTEGKARVKDQPVRVQVEEETEAEETGWAEDDADGSWNVNDSYDEAGENGKVSVAPVRRKGKKGNRKKVNKRVKGKGKGKGKRARRKALPSLPQTLPKGKTATTLPAGIKEKTVNRLPHMVVRSIQRNGRTGMKIIVWHPD